MPTWSQSDRFRKDLEGLSKEERKQFQEAVKKFVEDLRSGKFRRGLRIRGIQGAPGVFELTWEGSDGRATFQFGPPIHPNEPHVIWRRVGGHSIFDQP